MGTSFRPSTPADASGIATLLAEVGLRPSTKPEHLHWKYWQTREDWAGPRSFVLAQGDAIIAHAGIVPGSLLADVGRFRIVHAIDWAARPGAVGAGLSLMKFVGRLADGLLAVGGSAHARQILPHIGCTPYPSATGYVRTLRPLRIIRHARLSWRMPVRLVRSAVWRLSAPFSDTEGWTSRRIYGAELHQLNDVLPVPARELAVLERNVGLLRHALVCPIVPMELYVLEKEARVRGYFLLSTVPGQVRLADCWIDSERSTDWCALIQNASLQARRTAAAEIVAWSSDPLFSRCLEECGFHPRNKQPVLLKLHNGQSLQATALRVQMLDTDAPYLNAHHTSLWA